MAEQVVLALCETKSLVTGALNGFGSGLSEFTKWVCLFFSPFLSFSLFLSISEACKQTLVQSPQKTPVGVVEKTPPP